MANTYYSLNSGLRILISKTTNNALVIRYLLDIIP
jgi:hypothetical protein